MSDAPAGDRPRTRPPWLKLAVLAAACAATLYLGRQVVSVAVAKDAALTDPNRALAWRPHDSTALETAGEQAFDAAKTPADFARARGFAVRAVDRSPLDVGAVRLLALSAEHEGEAQRTLALMTIAGRRSERDGPAQAWLFDYWFNRRDWRRAFKHADLLLRTHPQATKQVEPALEAAAVADPAARRALTLRLDAAPWWRESFLSSLAQSDNDPSALLAIMTDLNAARAKLSNEELEEILIPLVHRHLYDEAYLTWTQSLPPKALGELGNIYDPDFNGLPGAAPFNWALHQPNGGAAEIASLQQGDRGHALGVHLYDAPTQPLAVQLLNLPPGRYQLSGQSLSEASAAGLEWTVRCDGGQVIARLSTAAVAGRWTRAAVSFEAPQTGCAAQWLELVAEPGASYQGSGVWWDKLAINRATP